MRTSCVAGDAGGVSDGDGDGDVDGEGEEKDLAWQQLRTVLSSRPRLYIIVKLNPCVFLNKNITQSCKFTALSIKILMYQNWVHYHPLPLVSVKWIKFKPSGSFATPEEVIVAVAWFNKFNVVMVMIKRPLRWMQHWVASCHEAQNDTWIAWQWKSWIGPPEHYWESAVIIWHNYFDKVQLIFLIWLQYQNKK